MKTKTDLTKVLLKHYSNFLRLFNRTEAEKLSLYRGKADYYIELEKVDRKELEVL